MRRIGVAVAGCGYIGAVHAGGYRELEDAELVATCDAIEERAREAAQKFGAKAWYSDYRDMLKGEDIDAVSICTPHYMHAEMAIAAAEEGKHILCEKPMAISLRQADGMIAAAKKAGVKLGVVSPNRFCKPVQKLRKAIDENKLGKLLLGDMILKIYRSDAYYASAAWRSSWEHAGGGLLINQGIAGVDVLQWFMGPVNSVYGTINTLTHKIEVEDTAIGIIWFKNGALGVIEGSLSIEHMGALYLDTITIHGTNGSVSIGASGRHTDYWLVKGDEEVKPNIPPVEPYPWPIEKIISVYFKPILEDFVSAIIQDRSPYVTGEEGRKSLEIVLAIYESSKTGQKIKFPYEERQT